jgi:hypothetical protein
MGKKQVAVSLRKPPPVDTNAFVAAGEGGVPSVSPMQANDGPPVSTRHGDRRELTIYLPVELARKLSVRCLELDRDLSNVVAEAVAKALAETRPEAVVTASESAWGRVRSVFTDLRSRLPARFAFF